MVANLAWVVASIAWFLDNWSAKPVLSDPGLGLLFAIVAGMSALQKMASLGKYGYWSLAGLFPSF